MTDIRTKEGRERLRATPPYELGNGEDEIYIALIAALDGLDIAEKTMRTRAVIDYLHTEGMRQVTGSKWFYWSDAVEDALREALAEWDKWKGETN